jgi:hypothetical protein
MSTIQTVVGGYRTKVDPLWTRCGVFTRDLSSFSGPARDASNALGFKAVGVMLDNTPAAAHNIAEMYALRNEYNAKGWKQIGWATGGQGSNPNQLPGPTEVLAEGVKARALYEAHKAVLAGWIVNIESWGELARAWVAGVWMEGWLKGHTTKPPLMLSCLSTTTANSARPMDFNPFLLYPKCAISPQCYSASNAAYTLTAMRAGFKKAGLPIDRLMPTMDVVKTKPIPTRYKRWRGPRWLWTGEDVVNLLDWPKVLVPGGCA